MIQAILFVHFFHKIEQMLKIGSFADAVNKIGWRGFNCKGPIIFLSKNTESAYKAMLYPNPTNGKFNISFSETLAQNVNITVYNLHGKLVYTWSHHQITTAEIDLTSFPKGIYIIKFITDEKNYFGKVSLE